MTGESAGNPGEWASRYQADFDTYQGCASKLEGLVRDLLTQAEIDVVDVASRAKDPESLARKVETKNERYDDPLVEVTDLIGVRVIAYYLEDVERINAIIADEFTVDDENSMDKLDLLESDRFGYRSVHHVISLNEQRSELAEWAIFNDKKAEIQVRTATQHAWAAVEHKLNYKRTSDAPRDLRRKLMRLSALFELADEQFSSVKSRLEEVEAKYAGDLREGNLDIPVDTTSLTAYLAKSRAVQKARKKAIGIGFVFEDGRKKGSREKFERDLHDLATLLTEAGIETIAEFDEVIRDRSEVDEAIEQLEPVFRDSPAWRSPADFLTILAWHLLRAPVKFLEPLYNDWVILAAEKARKGLS